MNGRIAWAVPAGLAGPLLAVGLDAVGSSDTGEFWIAMAVLAAAAAWGFHAGFKWWRWARLIEDTPTSRVRSAAQGYVELEGVARLMGGEPILAPLSRRPCTWWSFSVEEHVRDGNRRRWHTVSSGVSDHIFLIEDDSGSCVVDPDGAEVLPSARDTWYGDTPQPVAGPPLERGFVGFGNRYRYRESRLDAGAQAYAIGWFRSDTGADARSLGEEVAALLREWKREPHALLRRFDRDGDGALSLEEWERARGEAHSQVTAERDQRAAEPGVHMLSAPQDGRPFLLAAGSAGQLARHYRLRAAAGLALFLGCTCAVAWMIIDATP
ncbi:MAG: GIDE domain-containing protein [Steroidobacteraceae bacterium]